MTTVTIDSTLIERPTVFGNTTQYNVAEVIASNVPNLIAGGAGQSVTTSILFSDNQPSDTNYCISGVPSQPCAMNYANKTVEGFDVVMTPLSSGVTLAAGTFDLNISWPNGGEVE